MKPALVLVLPPLLAACAVEPTFEQQYTDCVQGAETTSEVAGFELRHQVIGARDDGHCRVRSQVVAHPEQALVEAAMICAFDPSSPLDASVEQVLADPTAGHACAGLLFRFVGGTRAADRTCPDDADHCAFADLDPVGEGLRQGVVHVAQQGDGAFHTISTWGLGAGEHHVVYHSKGSCEPPISMNAGPFFVPPDGDADSGSLHDLKAGSGPEAKHEIDSNHVSVAPDAPHSTLGRAIVVYEKGGRFSPSEADLGDPLLCGVLEPIARD